MVYKKRPASESEDSATLADLSNYREVETHLSLETQKLYPMKIE